MRVYFDRHVIGQTPLGLFTNLYPTQLCKVDRECIGGWYASFHLGTWRLTLIGKRHK